MDAKRRSLERAKRFLRKAAPLNAPCRVIVAPARRLASDHGIKRGGPTVLGDADYDEGRYRIRLAAELSSAEQAKTLAHEWAHCVVWRVPGDEPHHDALWRAANRRIWRELKIHMEGHT